MPLAQSLRAHGDDISNDWKEQWTYNYLIVTLWLLLPRPKELQDPLPLTPPPLQLARTLILIYHVVV
jgi:hypothetical protein